MGNVNMEADQVHVRDNSHKSWKTVADALKGLEASGASVAEDITELYTRDASRASKDDIANDFDAEQSYFAGDYVYYDGNLFKFTANHSGEWDPADVVIAQIGKAIADFSAVVDYSTTAQPTGQKWIDGKDIYFKTFEFTSFQQGSNNLGAVSANIDQIVKFDGVFVKTVSGSSYTLGISRFDDVNNNNQLLIGDDILFNLKDGDFATSSYKLMITVYYTKAA